MDSAGVGGGVSADRAGALARGIGGEVEGVPAGQGGDGLAELHVSHAGFDMGDAVVEIDLPDGVEACGGDEHAVVVGDASAGQAGAGAARDDLRLVLHEQAADLLHLLDGQREHHCGGAGLGDREAVGFVDEEFFVVGDDAIGREKRVKILDQRLTDGHGFVIRDGFRHNTPPSLRKGILWRKIRQHKAAISRAVRGGSRACRCCLMSVRCGRCS
jgi:hypothetical protein